MYLCVYTYVYKIYVFCIHMSFPGGSVVKNLLFSKQETRVPLGGREDPPEKEMATHSSILAWETPWAEEPAGLQWCLKRVGHGSATKQ